MLKSNYYHYLDADYRLIELLKTQSMWNTSGKGMDTGELSGFTSMISAI